ncbi:MAG: hemolysin III family protein [Chloroflexia bacterium]
MEGKMAEVPSGAGVTGAGGSPTEKPLLRGWFHAAAAVAAVAVTLLLAWLSSGDWPKMVSMLVFGLSMVELFTVSAVYHMGKWRPQVHRVLRALDHSNIFVIIAGTYTALCLNLLTGAWRVTILTLIWALALAGIALSVLTIGVTHLHIQVPRWAATGLYIAMGWVAVFALPELLQVLPWTAMALLLLGGALHTVGAVIYARKRPNPFPRVLGFHEIFHAFVVAGSVVFTIVVWVWVLPAVRG